MRNGFTASFTMILLAEIADKTFFIAAIMAMRYNKVSSIVEFSFVKWKTSVHSFFRRLVSPCCHDGYLCSNGLYEGLKNKYWISSLLQKQNQYCRFSLAMTLRRVSLEPSKCQPDPAVHHALRGWGLVPAFCFSNVLWRFESFCKQVSVLFFLEIRKFEFELEKQRIKNYDKN